MFGERVRELREEQGLFLRQMAAHLEVDTAYVSKIETGGRNANKEQVLGIIDFLKAEKSELLTLWLADKIQEVIQGEDYVNEALELVKKK